MRVSTVALGALALAAPLASAKAHSRRGFSVERRDHPSGADLYEMAKRQLPATSKNGMPYPEAGANPPPESSLPKEWIDRYNEKKAAGLIPNIPPSLYSEGTGVTGYPPGTDLKAACSWTLSKCDTGDLWLAPENSVAITFDDGPTPQSPDLIKYLNDNNQRATHFLIGSAAVWNADIMDQYVKADPPMHLGVHTWSHSIQTSKTDMEILGDLGWTSQIIYDLTGKVPMYFRPPEGDVDARVRAIAKEVFGLQTVMWNKDADDWCLRQGTGTAQMDVCTTGVGKDQDSVVKEMESWAKATSKKGFISLEHETTDQAINAFKKYHKALKDNNWNVMSVPDLQGLPYYQNQWNLTTKVEDVKSILPTRKAIDIVNSDAARGSPQAPDVSAFADLDGSGHASAGKSSSSSSSSSAKSSAASGSGSSSGSTSSQSASSSKQSQTSTSGAAQSGALLSTAGLASVAAVVALFL
ncbi:uncharacterized protein PFL1_02379 [Pseudozyma flocculosa PF-1]|uniref:chitin deacetylase n=1 Tax=Pseudozyma flocculosa TaxID=84751 RepID=A0A5C3F8X0_9BASI|nr:uncharacterized protein PFL1_02379 [Pseudozyma flocculosa PF-1]EPQ30263.1 hypothetical protein PFL1_02379 [Pseudozyma flocculosa PF-1]SPO39799.1 related to chitin deacetylase precursor [Pseudozyma flocculosa]